MKCRGRTWRDYFGMLPYVALDVALCERPSRNWVKTKCPDWKRVNTGRHKLFEGRRKPELTEAQKTLAKKRQELARVLDRLQSPGLTQGMERELRRHVAILEREIAELERT
jgi:hypothetical protein